MKQILKKLVVYIIILAVVFYLFPIPLKIGGAPKDVAFGLLIMLNPLVCLGTGAVFGIKHGFKWYFLLIAPLLFIPSCYIFYNEFMGSYLVIYMFFSAVGLGIGCIIRMFSKH
ncbi:hypothetical protein [Clostridium sp.]|uniref:hypothetical protein n=1 Tax=Clostridium sp. TaxID=1506 RepID=UPI003D6CC10F